jgi:hypothetical protein
LYQDKCARSKVEVTDSLLILVFELLNGCESAAEDIAVDGGKIGIASLELVCAGGDEVGGGKWPSDVRNEECHKGNIKGENGFNTMCHVERGVSSRLLSGCVIGPKCMRGDGWPLRDVTFTSLHNRLSYRVVLPFYNPIST